MITQGGPPNPVHLVRALLRECTYLPDPAACTYLRSYIVARFREYWPNKPGDSRSVLLPTESRQRNLLKQARKGLNTISLANTGHPKALQNVLAYTYGRKGKRRHELMRFLREADNLEDHESVAQLASTSFQHAVQGPSLTARMEALAKSQRVQKETALSKRPIKQLAPRIPEFNRWGRSMPLKRVRNMEKKWYGKLLDRINPPLPFHEWERLRDLARGKIQWSGVVPRRASAGEVSSNKNDIIRHQLTTRFMRRLWARIFLQCPAMKFNTSTSKWKVQWGSIDDRVEPCTVPVSSGNHSVFFQDVRDDGSFVKAPHLPRHKTSSA